MKKLHESTEVISSVSGTYPFHYVLQRPTDPKEVILLLHGLDERGLRLYRKLGPYLPLDALVIAPNGPFPLPRQKAEKIDYGYSWYFFDRFTQSYHINQDFARSLLQSLVNSLNTEKLPLTIIGFSQGGYLAPLVGYDLSETQLVIGLGCEFRSKLIHKEFSYKLVGIHGRQDVIIPWQDTQKEWQQLTDNGFKSELHFVEEAGHEVNSAIGLKVKEILEMYGKSRL